MIGVTEALPAFRSQIMSQSWIYILLAMFVPFLLPREFLFIPHWPPDSVAGHRIRSDLHGADPRPHPLGTILVLV